MCSCIASCLTTSRCTLPIATPDGVARGTLGSAVASGGYGKILFLPHVKKRKKDVSIMLMIIIITTTNTVLCYKYDTATPR